MLEKKYTYDSQSPTKVLLGNRMTVAFGVSSSSPSALSSRVLLWRILALISSPAKVSGVQSMRKLLNVEGYVLSRELSSSL
jgi:hypothetical protein